jgi:hypothetical protein
LFFFFAVSFSSLHFLFFPEQEETMADIRAFFTPKGGAAPPKPAVAKPEPPAAKGKRGSRCC